MLKRKKHWAAVALHNDAHDDGNLQGWSGRIRIMMAAIASPPAFVAVLAILGEICRGVRNGTIAGEICGGPGIDPSGAEAIMAALRRKIDEPGQ